MGCSAENVRGLLPATPSDSQDIEPDSFAEFVAARLSASVPPDLITDRVLRSYASTVPVVADARSFAADERNLRNWLARLVNAGASPATVRRYMGKMRALYAEYAGPSPEGEALFAALREAVQAEAMFAPFADREAIDCIKKIPLRIDRLSGPDGVTAAVLLFMLYAGGMGIARAVEAKFGDDLPELQQLADLVARQRDRRPKARYVFALDQSRHRPEWLAADVSARLTSFLGYLGYHPARPVTSETVLGWWVELALSRGFTAEQVAGAVPAVPSTHPWLALVKPERVGEYERLAMLQSVASAVNPSAAQWYAMRLRGRSTSDDVKALLDEGEPSLRREVHLFYPTHTAYKAAGKKVVRREVPWIRHILFVKTRPDRVAPLMNAVGSLGWVYKTCNRPGAPYSVIPSKAMVDFQRFIGVFDDATKVEFVRDPALVRGTRVRITGGRSAGCEGEIIKEDRAGADPDLRTFVLRIANDVTLKWEASVEEQYLEVIGR